LRDEGEFLLDDQKTAGTVAVTRGSASVVGTGTSWVAGDVGRQIKVQTSNPIYSISALDVGTQTITMDRVFGGTTVTAGTYRIFDGYVTAPDDFMRFIVVTDHFQGWRLRHWITQDELQSWDPQRNFFGQPYTLVDRRFNTLNTLQRPQYEAWPYATAQRTLHYFYVKRGDDLVNDTDTPIWPIRSDAIVSGALADLVRWPGDADTPNPLFFKKDLHLSYLAEFEDKISELERQDEDIFMTWLALNAWSQWPFTPLSANWIQTHAI
jgi:hypothetical protein